MRHVFVAPLLLAGLVITGCGGSPDAAHETHGQVCRQWRDLEQNPPQGANLGDLMGSVSNLAAKVDPKRDPDLGNALLNLSNALPHGGAKVGAVMRRVDRLCA